MSDAVDIRIGTAGWSIPRASASRFGGAGTHLERYARDFRCAEINSSFHRPHSPATYAKWRQSTPPGFRFAVKVPRTITHDMKLREVREPLLAFLAESDGLGEKRGPILVQLPPSLAFETALVTAFLSLVRDVYDGPVVCEPRHASWFAPAVARLLERFRVSRVAADPPRASAATAPAGWPHLAYFRLHGSPRPYWSRYDDTFVAILASTVRAVAGAAEVWCVFDNTAGGAAIENAWELRQRLMAASAGGP